MVFNYFNKKSLFKNPEDRANCTDLLEHVFITKYVNEANDLEFIKKVMDEVKKDVVEA